MWPLVLLFVATGLLVFRDEVERSLGFPVTITGSILAYIAAAWICSRLFGLVADRRRRRPYPRLFKDLVAVLLFFAAIVASGALLMGQGILGALAGSSLILAVLGFA